MTALRRNTLWIAGVAVFVLLPLGPRAQAPLERAQALYASARFDDALVILTNMQPATPAETVAAAKTRALCLLALGRSGEAETAFETLVEADPTARLTEADAAPRVRTLFAKVRGRVLTSLVHERFAEAKVLFAEGKHAKAAAAFRELRTLIDDPDLAKTGETGISDLRVLVDGFLELTDTASKERPSSRPLQPLPTGKVLGADAPLAAGRPAGAPVDSRAATDAPGIVDDDGNPSPANAAAIVPPVVVNQPIPHPRDITLRPATLVIEVLIDEQGRVERATLRESVHPVYDRMVLAATKRWEYRPATRNGRPVKFVKTIEITVRR